MLHERSSTLGVPCCYTLHNFHCGAALPPSLPEIKILYAQNDILYEMPSPGRLLIYDLCVGFVRKQLYKYF